MADITYAKAGDRLSAKAIKRLEKTNARIGGFVAQWGDTVQPYNPEHRDGRWLCIDCGERPQNNMGAHSHAEKPGAHRFAWMSSDSMQIEAPVIPAEAASVAVPGTNAGALLAALDEIRTTAINAATTSPGTVRGDAASDALNAAIETLHDTIKKLRDARPQ